MTTAGMERTAWLFTRAADSVRIEVRGTSQGVQLDVEGPGHASATYEFAPGASVHAFRQDYESRLLADGFKLQVVAERRSAPRRHGGESERRRR